MRAGEPPRRPCAASPTTRAGVDKGHNAIYRVIAIQHQPPKRKDRSGLRTKPWPFPIGPATRTSPSPGGRPRHEPWTATGPHHLHRATRVAPDARPRWAGRPSRAWPASPARRASAAGRGATPVAARRHPGCHPRPPGRAADARLPGHAGACRAQRRPLAPERRIRLPDAPAARGRGPRHGRGPRRPTHLRADGRRPHRGHRHPGRTALVAVRRRGRPPRARPGARRRCAPGLPGRLADRPRRGPHGPHEARRALYRLLADDDAGSTEA